MRGRCDDDQAGERHSTVHGRLQCLLHDFCVRRIGEARGVRVGDDVECEDFGGLRRSDARLVLWREGGVSVFGEEMEAGEMRFRLLMQVGTKSASGNRLLIIFKLKE